MRFRLTVFCMVRCHFISSYSSAQTGFSFVGSY